jgi:hypothetical protein
MRNWLDSEEAWFIPNYAEKHFRDQFGREKSSHAFIGRQGIFAFFNFWGPGNTGEHIDVWNGSRIALGDNNYFERSEEIWFWPIP